MPSMCRYGPVMISVTLWKTPFKLTAFHHAKSILVHEIDYASGFYNSIPIQPGAGLRCTLSDYARNNRLVLSYSGRPYSRVQWMQLFQLFLLGSSTILFCTWYGVSLSWNRPSIFQKIPITIHSNEESQSESSHLSTYLYILLWPEPHAILLVYNL